MANNPLNNLRTARSIADNRPRTRKEAAMMGADLASAAIARTNPLLGVVAKLTMRHPRFILWSVVATTALTAFVAVFFFITVLTVVTATALQPLQVISSVIGWVPGLGPDDAPQEAPPEQLCVAQPPSAPPADADHSGDPSVQAEAPTSPAPEQSSRAALSDNGRITDWVMGLARQAPEQSEARKVQAWLLFAMAHPDDPRAASWQSFAEPYDQAARIVSPHATGSDIANTIDASANYQPYTLAAASLTLAGIMDHRFTDETDLADTLSETVIASCTTKTQAGASRKPSDPNNPVLPARSPGWSSPLPAPSEGQQPPVPSTVGP